jgi:hypothetical protein
VDDGVDCTDDSCDEDNDEVVHVPDDGLCDNKLFCDGVETCDVLLDCQPGSYPCTDADFPFCDEDADTCVVCLGIGDGDGDGNVDLFDYAGFFECVTGPVGPVDPPAYGSECRCFDSDEDGDIDLIDFGALQLHFNAP